MSLDKLLKQIRVIIREEIEYALEKKLTESRKPDDKKALSHGMSLMKELANVKKKEPPVNRPKKTTGIKSIQDILNETRLSMESAMADDGDEDMYDEYPEVRFNSNSVARSNVSAIPKGYDASNLTPEVSKALTRDYSALVAKMNEKKGS